MRQNMQSFIKNIFNTVFSISVFIVSALFLTSCTSFNSLQSSDQANQGWTLVSAEKKVKKPWKIYSRKLKDTNFVEYKIEGELASSPTHCLSALKQNLYNDANDAKKYPTYEILKSTSDSILTYVIHNEPFPLNDTEMNILYQFHSEQDGSTHASWKEAWDINPVSTAKGLNRVETFRGTWHFLPLKETSAQGINIVQFDPKKMPRWLAEPMVLKFLKTQFKKFSKTASI